MGSFYFRVLSILRILIFLIDMSKITNLDILYKMLYLSRFIGERAEGEELNRNGIPDDELSFSN